MDSFMPTSNCGKTGIILCTYKNQEANLNKNMICRKKSWKYNHSHVILFVASYLGPLTTTHAQAQRPMNVWKKKIVYSVHSQRATSVNFTSREILSFSPA